MERIEAGQVTGSRRVTAARPADRAGATRVTIRCGRSTAGAEHRDGMTILDMARFLGMNPPANCESGHCGACTARIETGGGAEMRRNEVLTTTEVAEGWVLTCQAHPTGESVHVVYE
ncbi:2Fe-2S iron-sulfur cluster binding domain-containing protein [Nocardia sp. NPDC019395]|uniref:2Fe-2S iron-sulfur cluster-binding protein n=1 Tax=Nocardia sp. NPDC019395 TaxID=3154686 RepID=UPI0033CF7B77